MALITKVIKDKTYTESPELKSIAEQLIETETILKDSYIKEAKIAYILVYPYISKTTIGRVIKANSHTKFYSDYDYVIEISGDFWDALTKDEVKNIIMLHELMHIKVIYNEKKGHFVYKLQDHDVKDFHYIISKYGIEWLEKVNLTFQSVYELENISIGDLKL